MDVLDQLFGYYSAPWRLPRALGLENSIWDNPPMLSWVTDPPSAPANRMIDTGSSVVGLLVAFRIRSKRLERIG